MAARSYTVITDSSDTEPLVASEEGHTEDESPKERTSATSENHAIKFQKARIYLEEGRLGEKLEFHPETKLSTASYIIIHNSIYYNAQFIVGVLLMSLAFLERPTFLQVPFWVPPVVEIYLLVFIFIDVVMKSCWRRKFYWNIWKHRNISILKAALILLMLTEAGFVLGRRKNHFRVSRCLRPFFLLDIEVLHDVRRLLRQIFFESLKPIIDVLLLLFFFVACFAVSGFYLFATDSPTNFQFNSFGESLISLYILMTTSNFPDVMMESYSLNPLAPIFFVVFLIIGLYIIINILLATVYSTFKENQKKKFLEMTKFKRMALKKVFDLLSRKDDNNSQCLHLKTFLEMMEVYSPFTSRISCTCMFNAMKLGDRTTYPTHDDLKLSEEGFKLFYQIQGFTWNRLKASDSTADASETDEEHHNGASGSDISISTDCISKASDSTIDASKTGEQDHNSAPMSESSISHISYEDIMDGQTENPTHKDVVQVPEVAQLDALNQGRIPQKKYILARWYNRCDLNWKCLTDIAESKRFKASMNVFVLISVLIFFILSLHIKDSEGKFEQSLPALILNFSFLTVYSLEIIFKVIAIGPVHFVRSYWNIFDVMAVIISFIFEVFQVFSPYYNFMVPLRFIRLIRFNKRFRTLINAFAIVLPRIIDITVLLIFIYYFFAIIGMECFSGEVYQYCCNDTKNIVGSFYTGYGSNKYYLNNFDSILKSYVTLFELMIVNNWWIIMEGFHYAVGDRRVRIFFILFHLTTTVVLTVAIAFIVDAFQFRMGLNEQKFRAIIEQVKVNKEHIATIEEMCSKRRWWPPICVQKYWPWEMSNTIWNEGRRSGLMFEGTKRHTKEDINKDLYAEENKKTLLHEAVENGNEEMVNKLITTGRADINAVEMDHATPLHYAAKYGHTSIARILIKHKANVDAQNIDGNTPLELAEINGHGSHPIVQELKGGDENENICKSRMKRFGHLAKQCLYYCLDPSDDDKQKFDFATK